MRRKFQKLLIFTSAMIIFFIIYQLFMSRSILSEVRDDSRDKNNFIKYSSSNKVFRNPIWEQMNKNVFFKRTSAFFIIERSLLRIYFLRRKYSINYEYDFRIKIKSQRKWELKVTKMWQRKWELYWPNFHEVKKRRKN